MQLVRPIAWTPTCGKLLPFTSSTRLQAAPILASVQGNLCARGASRPATCCAKPTGAGFSALATKGAVQVDRSSADARRQAVLPKCHLGDGVAEHARTVGTARGHHQACAVVVNAAVQAVARRPRLQSVQSVVKATGSGAIGGLSWIDVVVFASAFDCILNHLFGHTMHTFRFWPGAVRPRCTLNSTSASM